MANHRPSLATAAAFLQDLLRRSGLPFTCEGASESFRDPTDGCGKLDKDALHGPRRRKVHQRGLVGHIAPVPLKQTHGCLHVHHRRRNRMTSASALAENHDGQLPPLCVSGHQRWLVTGSLQTAQRRPHWPLGFRLGHAPTPPGHRARRHRCGRCRPPCERL
jgi:hypothetical protein